MFYPFNYKLNKLFYLFIFLSVFADFSIAQDLDITPYLKQIEKGQKLVVKNSLPVLKKENPNEVSLLYLEGLVQDNSEQSTDFYEKLLDTDKDNKYADECAYRLYCYYDITQDYSLRDKYKEMILSYYPASKYVNIIKSTNQYSAENKNLTGEKPVVLNQKKTKETVKETSKTSDTQVVSPLTEVSETQVNNNINYKFTIQVGAFTKKENAVLLNKKIISSKITSFIKERSVGGTIFYTVYAGKYLKKEQAENDLEKITEDYNPEAKIVSKDYIK